MAATAEQVPDEDLARAVELYPGADPRGGRTITPDEVRPPAR
jgi:hypothetical protein